MISEILKNETRKQHTDIESTVDIMEHTQSKEKYESLLKAFYGFYRPVEKSFIEYKDQFKKLGLDLEPHLKTRLLEHDLKEMNVDLDSIKIRPDHKFSSLGEAMGCFYVLEGSTLGGQVIFKSLKKNGIKTGESEICFHNPYGAETMKNWLAFKTSLDSTPASENDALLESAKETFTELNKWLAKQLNILSRKSE